MRCFSVFIFPARRSLTASRPWPRTPPSSPRPWDSPNARYMSPTTSSRAKISRCVSVGDGLHLDRAPAELKNRNLKPRSCQRLSSPFDAWPSRSGSPRDPSHAVTSDLERPRVLVTADDQGLLPLPLFHFLPLAELHLRFYDVLLCDRAGGQSGVLQTRSSRSVRQREESDRTLQDGEWTHSTPFI